VTARRRATYDDLCRVPEHFVAEIVDGELFTSPRPKAPHARVAMILATQLAAKFDQPARTRRIPGGWWFLFEPELHFGGDVLVPDIAGWRRETMPVIPDVPGFKQAPDWLCEVTSPSTRTLDRTRKMRIYAREGVRFVWLVDPTPRTLEVYRSSDAQTLDLIATHTGRSAVRAEPFEAVALLMSRWWLSAA
jgi:Uma2 family endonuclease